MPSEQGGQKLELLCRHRKAREPSRGWTYQQVRDLLGGAGPLLLESLDLAVTQAVAHVLLCVVGVEHAVHELQLHGGLLGRGAAQRAQ